MASLVAIGERVGFDGGALAKASRLVAKVDSAAMQTASIFTCMALQFAILIFSAIFSNRQEKPPRCQWATTISPNRVGRD
jgi:hypothetical protein